MELGPRSDVRRQCTHAVHELLRRALEVEPTVARVDLRRVARLAGLLAERRSGIGQNRVEKRRCDLRSTGVDDAGVVVRADRKGLLCRDRACVELVHELDDRDARLPFPASSDRSTGAAPRQRGRSEGWTLSHR